jgi:hypothetical protein
MGRFRTVPQKKERKGFWFASMQDIPEEDAVLLPLASSSLSTLVHLAAVDLDTTQQLVKATSSSPPPPQWCRNQFWPSSLTLHDIVPPARKSVLRNLRF